MTTSRGTQLAQDILQKMENLKVACAGIDEETASRAPEGRWSPKEILSHLCGPEGEGHLPFLKSFVQEDTPFVDLRTEDPFFTDARARTSFAQLVQECEREYQGIARFATELTEEQLGRKAHIPKLKESPLGEYPTLEGMISGLGQYHLADHTNHLKEILAELGK